MTQIPLKEAVRQHVEERRLSDTQYEALLKLQQDAAPEAQPPTRSPAWFVFPAAAAAVAVAVVVAALLWAQDDTRGTPEAIAAEVARNHIKLKPLEVESARMDDIRAFFVELDFAPIESAVVDAAGLKLEGGRYCAIQGVEAAQLRVRDPITGGVRSVYMVPYARDVFGGDMPIADQGDAPLTLHARGLKVQIWVEQDVLLAMTGDP